MPATHRRAGSLLVAILFSGLLVGLLDGLAAIIQYTINGGTKPASIFKYIASAVFGKDAFSGGTPMVIWGVCFHLLIALSFTAFFYLVPAKMEWVNENRLLAGILYGLFVWVVMTRIVVPLSKINQPKFDFSKASIAALILIVCIGIPLAFMSTRYYRLRRRAV